MGTTMIMALCVLFAAWIQAAFELKPYDDYYSGQRLQRILHSKAQAERGEVITKTFAELEAMENE